MNHIPSKLTDVRALAFVIALVGIGLAANSGWELMAIPQDDNRPTPAEARVIDDLDAAEDLFNEQKWTEAITILTRVTKDDPDNGTAWFQLGYALHMTDQIDEAIKADTKAAEFPGTRILALYNLACAYATQGQTTDALRTLNQAYAAGYADTQSIQNDSDLKDLRAAPNFKMPEGMTLEEMKTDEGSQLQYYLILPRGFDAAKTYPVLLGFPPGSQRRSAAETGASMFWGEQAAQRGWIVLSLIVPDGGWLRASGNAVMTKLMKQLEAQYNIEGGKFYVAGCSGGGASSFRIAIDFADWVHALVGLPANAESYDADEDRLSKLVKVRVRLLCGGDDRGWLMGIRMSG